MSALLAEKKASPATNEQDCCLTSWLDIDEASREAPLQDHMRAV